VSRLLDAVPHGREHALTKTQIASRLGVSSRVVEHEIEELRKSGRAAICSDSQVGYWQPRTADEYRDNVAARRRRALSQLQTNRGEKRALRALEAREAGPLTFRWDGA
jgi:biotin operon repressor